jgi:sucrose-6-phosphate hydrolase SacC (GH32 family)
MKTKEILKIVFLAVVVSPVVCGAEPREADKMQAYRSPIHFMPSKREVGDVMPFYWKGEYHVFYLTNPTGNHDVNWEHTVFKVPEHYMLDCLVTMTPKKENLESARRVAVWKSSSCW